MFSMIITVVAIVLIALLALATIFYGGDIFNRGNQKANAAKMISDIAQIEGAIDVHRTREGMRPETESDLVPQYLHTLPMGWEPDAVRHGYMRYTGKITVETCIEVNDFLGIDNPGGQPPACDPQLGIDEELVFRGCCMDTDI